LYRNSEKLILKTTGFDLRRMIMNWVFGAYSNVYSTAMMQNKDVAAYLADAKLSGDKSMGLIARLFGRT
jgi:hypothetical protein